MPAEHDRADLDGTNAAGQVELHRQRLGRVGQRRDVRQRRAGVDVDRVAARRVDDRVADLVEVAAEVGRLRDAVAQVVLVQGLVEADGDRVEVASGQPAVGREALGEDEQILLAPRQHVVVGAQEAADVGQAVLLGAHRAAVAQGHHLARDVDHAVVGKAPLAQLHEVGVLAEATGVEVERDAVGLEHLLHGAHVGHRHRLPAARVVGEGQHAHGDTLGAHLVDERLQPLGVHVALEGVLGLRLVPLGDHQVEGLRALELDVGARGVEVGVVGHDVAGLAHRREEDALGGPPLVGRDDVAIAEDVPHGRLEAVEAAAAGIGLVPAHHAGPLLGAHRAGSAVGEQVDDHVVGLDLEEVEARLLQDPLALLARRLADRLDGLDAEGLEDRAIALALAHDRHGRSSLPSSRLRRGHPWGRTARKSASEGTAPRARHALRELRSSARRVRPARSPAPLRPRGLRAAGTSTPGRSRPAPPRARCHRARRR